MAPAPDQAALLRHEVWQLRRRETRRVFDPMLYVGVLGRPAPETFTVRRRDLPVLDDALRTEVVSRLVEDAGDPTAAWLTRSGTPEVFDCDLAWLAAALRGFGLHGRSLDTFHTITRYGWRDVRTGEERHWRRLRL